MNIPPIELYQTDNNQPTPPLCLYPWFHQKVSTDGTAQPCCNYTNQTYIEYQKFFNSGYLKTIRQEMLSGKIPDGCKDCIYKESRGWPGRQFSFDIINDLNISISQEIFDNPKLQFIEIDYSNICNLSCKMCSSDRSFKIGNFEKKLNIKPKPLLDSNFRLSEDEIDSVLMLKFLGGEPLLHQDRIINELNRLKLKGRLHLVEVFITTNGSLDLLDEFIELIKNCKKIQFNFSIDAYNTLNEYIRTSSDWNKIVNNISSLNDIFKESNNIHIGILTTVGILNINKLNELFDFLQNNFPENLFHKSYLPILMGGHEHYSVSNLPVHIKELLFIRYDKWIDEFPLWKSHIKKIKGYLNYPSRIDSNTLLSKFNRRNSAFELPYKPKFNEVNKEMSDWLNF